MYLYKIEDSNQIEKITEYRASKEKDIKKLFKGGSKMRNYKKDNKLKSITALLCATIMIMSVLVVIVPKANSATTIVIDFEEFRATSLGGLGGLNEK